MKENHAKDSISWNCLMTRSCYWHNNPLLHQIACAQPLIAKLLLLEECMPPTNVRQNDGQDDQEAHNKKINKTTVDANGYQGDTPKYGQGEDMLGSEEDSC